MYSFEVYNIFILVLQEYDKNIAYIGLKKAQSLLGFDFNEFTGLIIENNQNSSIDVPYPFIMKLGKKGMHYYLNGCWFNNGPLILCLV